LPAGDEIIAVDNDIHGRDVSATPRISQAEISDSEINFSARTAESLVTNKVSLSHEGAHAEIQGQL
jgi:hypothetical protein